MKKNKYLLLLFIHWFFILPACQNANRPKAGPEPSFADIRKGFTTKLIKQTGAKEDVEMPPEELFDIVQYPTKIGNMAAYLSVVPNDNKLHPAMIWVSGGFGNEIGDVWTERNEENDQSAFVIGEVGVIMMYPSQRGGNSNPGADETCYGEIDDILAAASFLSKQKGIDPKRIYLGGHSTGGTKVLLAAECSKMFRAVFSCGAITSVIDYGEDDMTFETNDTMEIKMRAPIAWLKSIHTPVYVFEGASGSSNIGALRKLEERAKEEHNPYIHFYEVENKDHFSALQPVCKIIARKIMEDLTGGEPKMDFTADIKAIP